MPKRIGKYVVENKRAIEQINGREGETATLLSTAFGELGVACVRFRPTSSQPLGGTLEIERKFTANKFLIVCYNSTFRRFLNIAEENLYL